jgi:AraC family transcriptional regulator
MQNVFPAGAHFSEDNLVLNARARRHVVQDFAGPLSIKTVMDGEVGWIVDGRRLVVDTSSFLVLNDGQKYSMDFEATRSMETCIAFFQRGFVERIAQDATSPVQASLDRPDRDAPALHFLSRLHRDPEGRIIPYLRSLAERCSKELQPSSFEENFLVLSEQLVLLYQEIAAQLSRVPGMKTSTREELFRRLQLAKEYMHSSAEQSVSLDAVAKEACLSRYHLHRSFSQVFGQTPHAYLTALRLERAHSLLTRGNSVTDVCMAVGFSSVSSFSRLFRKQFGCSPSSIKLTESRRR